MDRGTFSICSDSFCTVMELAAHVSNKASLKVFEAARRFPTLLHLKVHPRLQLWPKSFCRSELTDGQIGLYFFPEGERCSQALVASSFSQFSPFSFHVIFVVHNIFTGMEDSSIACWMT